MKNIDKQEILEFLSDTSQLLSKATVAVGRNNIAASYAENVEFWQWLDTNYKTIDPEASSIVEFLEKKGNHNQFFGKLYEWDYFNHQRDRITKLFSDYNLPQTPNNPGIDLEENTLFFGTKKYQLKGHRSGVPDINEKTTPYSTKVVTNIENVQGVERQGYETEAFMDKQSIKARRDEMLEKGLDREADFSYEPLDIGETMSRGALFGIAIGVGTETLISYREYKSGKINSKDYVQRILKSGAERGITAGATTGVMIPVNAMLTGAGLAGTPIAIPVAFLVHQTIAAPISAAFGKGEYKKILQDAKIYDNTSEMMKDFGALAYETNKSFNSFIANSLQSDGKFIEARKNFDDSMNILDKMLGGNS